jgi:hypothetical protein
MPLQDRDHAVEQWLRQTPIAGARADACLDAETMAAWTEGTLDAPLRSMAEAHAATCGRCQEMLAIMLRTTPVATASAGSPIRKWLMMLGPALAAATAVALWIAVDRRPAPTRIDTLAKQEAARESAVGAPAEDAASAVEKDAKARDDSSDRVAKERSAERFGAANEALVDKADRREPSSVAAAKPNDEERRRADLAPAPATAPLRAPAAVASAPPPAAAPVPPVSEPVVSEQQKRILQDQLQRQSQNQNQNAANQAAQGQNSVNQSQLNQAPQQNQAPGNQSGQQQPRPQQEALIVTGESPAPQPQAARPPVVEEKAAAAGRGGSAQGFAGARLDAVAGLTFDVTVNDQKARWRVVEGRLVQRSLDQGRSWSTQYAIDAGPGRINAGICPAAAVCWLAGRSGLVLRTIDGQSWQRLAFSQDIELTSVSSTDERTATVTAADGRRFVTTDAGRTWVQK